MLLCTLQVESLSNGLHWAHTHAILHLPFIGTTHKVVHAYACSLQGARGMKEEVAAVAKQLEAEREAAMKLANSLQQQVAMHMHVWGEGGA